MRLHGLPAFPQSRDHTFQSKAMSDMVALYKEQARLERELSATGQVLSLVGGSVSDSLQLLMRHGHMRQALALKKMFAVGDRRFWWLRIRCVPLLRAAFAPWKSTLVLCLMEGAHTKNLDMAWLPYRVLCEAHDWEGLDAMAGERKTHPVGWEPFLESARKHGAPREVLARLIGRTPDSAAKVGLCAGATVALDRLWHRWPRSTGSPCGIRLHAPGLQEVQARLGLGLGGIGLG